MFDTDRALIWRLVLEQYGTDIEYIWGDKNIVTYALSVFPINVNQDATHESTNKNGVVSEIIGT